MNHEIPKYKRALWNQRLEALFDGDDREEVRSWLLECEERERVIVVGAGFTRNVKRPDPQSIPVWADLTQAMAEFLRVNEQSPTTAQDALELADLFVSHHGRHTLEGWLGRQLDDESIEVGEAHGALWESMPAAVVTTNFLDTALERPPTSLGIPIFDCTHLTRPLTGAQRHLLYFHGHRSAPRTWVVSRRDYEDIDNTRPLLQVKFRQLLAEFPALIVGYSLSDPDFHLLYRETAELLKGEHPPALVLLPRPTEGETRLSALRREYWKTMRVRLVHFSAGVTDLDRAHRDFFRLTEKPNSYHTLEGLLKPASRPARVSAACGENVEIAQSIVADVDQYPFLRGQLGRLWKAALERALPDDQRKDAERCSSQAVAFRISSQRAATQTRDAAAVEVPSHPCPLGLADWAPGSPHESGLDEVFAYLRRMDVHYDVRVVESALKVGIDRELVKRWLVEQVREDSGIGESLVATVMLAVLTWGDSTMRALCANAAARLGNEDLGKLLGVNAEPITPPKGIAAELIRAREYLLDGERQQAEELYVRVLDELGAAPVRDGREELAAYFAARGLLELTSWMAERDLLELRQRQHDRLEELPGVIGWQVRIQEAIRSALAAAAGRNGNTARSDGYERRSFGANAAPGRLWEEYEWAARRGAPVVALCDLLRPLCGTFPSSKDELELRLEYDLEKPGEWLLEELRERQFTLLPSEMFIGSEPAATRGEIVSAINRQLFPGVLPKSGLRLRSRLSALASCAQVLEADRAQDVMQLLGGGAMDSDESLCAQAWAGIVRCFSWGSVGKQLVAYVRGASEREEDGTLKFAFRERNLVQRLAHLPWEHWVICDDFMNHGGSELVEAMLKIGGPWKERVGWALRVLLVVTPREQKILEFALRWLEQVSSQDLNDSEFAPLVGVLSEIADVPTAFSEPLDRAIAYLQVQGEPELWLLAAEGENETLQQVGRSRLLDWYQQENFGSLADGSIFARSHTREVEAILWAAREQKEPLSSSAEDWILNAVRHSWRSLPPLGKALARASWSARGWQELGSLLRYGSVDAQRNEEWKYCRIELLATHFTAERYAPKTGDGDDELLTVLKKVALDAIFEGDWYQANRAIYLLPDIAEEAQGAEIDAVILALRRAADDLRIEVAHGAAYGASLLRHREAELPRQIFEAVVEVDEKLKSDSCAIIQRQRQYGEAIGRRGKASVDSGEHLGA